MRSLHVFAGHLLARLKIMAACGSTSSIMLLLSGSGIVDSVCRPLSLTPRSQNGAGPHEGDHSDRRVSPNAKGGPACRDLEPDEH